MLRFQVSNKVESRTFNHETGPIEFGRGSARNGLARCVVQDKFVSRDHLAVEEIADGRVRIENLSQKNRVRLTEDVLLEPGEIQEFALPLRLAMGETVIDIALAGSEAAEVEQLQTIAVPVRGQRLAETCETWQPLTGSPTAEVLARWFETVIGVQRAAASSPEFYQQTAQALVDLVGLDRGLVLLRKGEGWQVAARCVRENAQGREFSKTILKQVVDQGRTFFQPVGTQAATTESLQGVEAVVASPIFDPREQVVGALYGSRTHFPHATSTGIGNLEAQLVQLLACAVGAGLARLDQETQAARLRVQFEQFFPGELARQLETNPQLLEGQEREITVLHCDIRGFSRLAERLGPRETCRWLAEVMDRLVTRVREFDGVVVDYTGDGFMAMWNAPTDQQHHAVLACRAALAMLAELPGLRSDSRSAPGEPLGLGIGINTGPALVGNVGSRHKFKYGPMGHTVNLGSRVESAGKQLGVPALITKTTHTLVEGSFATRRIGRVRVVGLDEVVELFELHAETATPEWQAGRDAFEKALTHFEAGQWAETCRLLYPLLHDRQGKYDLPCLDLLARSVECLRTPGKAFDPVKELVRK